MVNIDGAVITSEAIATIKFLQQEDYVDQTLNQINEIIDIVVDENIPAVLESDKAVSYTHLTLPTNREV